MKKRPQRAKSSSKLPKIVYAQASPLSISGTSLFEYKVPVTHETVQNFYSRSEIVNSASNLLRGEGFNVLDTNQITLNIAGPPELYERVFNTTLITEEKDVIKKLGKVDTATFIDCEDAPIPGLIPTTKTTLKNVIEGVALEKPVYYMSSPTYFPPTKSYWHLDVPADVSAALNADGAQRMGITGRKIKVVMCDSGHYKHPFFDERGYHVAPVVLGPAAANPDHDESGHGTGESANIFAVAPDVDFTMVKMNFVNSVGAFNAAVALHPNIISCSWGSSIRDGPLSAADQTLAAAIANAVSQGIVVVFSAGNGHWGFPGQHPDVISAGGVFMHEDGSFEATPYASGFASRVYPGRNCPDVCGLVGLPPRAEYIMLPVEPNDEIDTELSGGTYPNGDETAADDGWAAFSGTSAAAPQIAGICALLKQARSELNPVKIRDILKKTARDVTRGNCSPSTGGNPALPGPDLATGSGLADASKAIMVAMVQSLVAPRPALIPSPLTSVPSELKSSHVTEDTVIALEDMLLGLMK